MKTADIRRGERYAVSTFPDYQGSALCGIVLDAKGREVTVSVRVYDELRGRHVPEIRTVRPQDIREPWDEYATSVGVGA